MGTIDQSTGCQIGWLRAGKPGPSGRPQWVECLDCASYRLAWPDWTPLFEVNVRPYKQPCGRCGRELTSGQTFDCVLFDGEPRS